MKKPGRRKKPLRSRKHRRAKKKAHDQKQTDQRELRLMKIESGWKPPTKEEKDEEIAERQVRQQEKAEAAKKRKKEREAAREEEAKKQIGLTARLRAWMAKKAEERNERIMQDAEARRVRRAEQRERGAELGR